MAGEIPGCTELDREQENMQQACNRYDEEALFSAQWSREQSERENGARYGRQGCDTGDDPSRVEECKANEHPRRA